MATGSDRTRIVGIKHSGLLVTLRFSTRDKPVTLPVTATDDLALTEGGNLSSEQMATILERAQRYQVEREADRLLAASDHSSDQLRSKLLRKGHPRAVVEDVIAEFERQSLLDDERFARSVAERLLRQKPAGRAYVVATLQAKMIDRLLAERIADEVLRDRDETELAAQALTQRWREYRQFDIEVARRKAYSYLARRGFGFAAARQAFEQLHPAKRGTTGEETDD